MLPQLEGPGRASRLGASSSIVALSLLAFVVQSACGSEDGKKRVAPTYSSGGENAGGEPTSSGNSSKGGKAQMSTAGEGGVSTSGTGGTNPSLGGESAGGEVGEPVDKCPKGTADCDENPDDCETDVTLLTECGACGVSCKATNGTVICGETGCEMTTCNAGFGDCNETGNDGCETALTTTTDCGVCGHGCGGAACTAGLCAGTQLGSAAAAYRWVANDEAIYRLTGYTGGYGVSSTYSLTRTPLSGAAEVIMAAENKGAGGLAVDDTNVYWAVSGTPPAVFKKARNATAAALPMLMFEPVSLPVQLKVEGGAMYWTALDGQIYTRALDADVSDPGAALITADLVKGSGVFGLHQDFVTTPTSMYWVVLPAAGNQALIRTAGVNGKNVADVAGAITNPYLKLWVSGEDIYWVRATGAASDGAYHFKKGGKTESLVLQANFNAVATSGDYLYLLTGNDLYRSPVLGGVLVKLGDGAGLAALTDFAGVDDANVYGLTGFTHGAGFAQSYKMVSFPK